MLLSTHFLSFYESTGLQTKRGSFYTVSELLNRSRGKKVGVWMEAHGLREPGDHNLGWNSLGTVGRVTPGFALCTSHWRSAGRGCWGRGQLTPKQARTFCLSVSPQTTYAHFMTCIFFLFTFLTLIFMSYNLGKKC